VEGVLQVSIETQTEQWEKIFAADAGFPDRHQQWLGIVEALLDSVCEKSLLKVSSSRRPKTCTNADMADVVRAKKNRP
jgi:hypothetical protein